METGAESVDRESVVEHFVARAPTYDSSSAWCTDEALGRAIVAAAALTPDARVLDVACGTGLVSGLFHRRVAQVVGVDLTWRMANQARGRLDDCVIGSAEDLPFDDDRFDVVVCRQGIQFMGLPEAVREMVRVARPAGRIVLANLCAYGPGDRELYAEILRLRNPARRHFFVPDDLTVLLRDAGCDAVEVHRLVSIEDVGDWADNGAIDARRQDAIRVAYRSGSPEFRHLHLVPTRDDRLVDRMLFVVATGRKG